MSADRDELAQALEASELAQFVADAQDIADVLMPAVGKIAARKAAEELRKLGERSPYYTPEIGPFVPTWVIAKRARNLGRS